MMDQEVLVTDGKNKKKNFIIYTQIFTDPENVADRELSILFTGFKDLKSGGITEFNVTSVKHPRRCRYNYPIFDIHK